MLFSESVFWLVSFSATQSVFGGLIGFADPHPAGVAQNRFATGPVLRERVADADRAYAIASLNATGSVTKLSQSISFDDDSLMPGCNAAFDAAKGIYYKTTMRVTTFQPASGCGTCPANSTCCKDPAAPGDTGACFTASSCSQIPSGTGTGGNILTIDATSGKVLHNVSMSGDVAHPVFGAFDAASNLMYSIIPYSYTEYGLFSYSPTTGAVKQLTSWPKTQLDGIGLCDGLSLQGSKLVFQFGGATGSQHLMVVDLKTKQVTSSVEGFYGPIAIDPLHSNRLLAIQNMADGDANAMGVKLVWVDLMQNQTSTVFSLNKTTLGEKLRAQDQASIAVSPDGTTVWFIASYNDPKTGLLYRGVYTVQLAKDRSTGALLSEKESFGEPHTTWLGRLDFVQGTDGTAVVV